MSIRDKFKSWPEEKKKMFSIMAAGVITLGIAITWFSFNPIFTTNNIDNNIQTNNTDYFGDTLNKITEQYNLIKDQISNLTGTSSTSTEISSSTTQ